MEAAEPRGDRVAFVRSRAKSALLLVGGLLLAGISFLMAIDPGLTLFERAIGWVGAAFFGLTVLVGAAKTIRGGIVFAFDPGGITDHANALVISWNEIERCEVVSVHGAPFLGLVIQQPDAFVSRLSFPKRMMARLDERMGCGHWALSFSDVSPDVDAALEFIRRHAPSVLAARRGERRGRGRA